MIQKNDRYGAPYQGGRQGGTRGGSYQGGQRGNGPQNGPRGGRDYAPPEPIKPLPMPAASSAPLHSPAWGRLWNRPAFSRSCVRGKNCSAAVFPNKCKGRQRLQELLCMILCRWKRSPSRIP